VLDGVGMGLGFTFAITVLSIIRELIGNGTIFGFQILGEWYQPVLIFVQPPGAFIALGLLIGLVNFLTRKKKA